MVRFLLLQDYSGHMEEPSSSFLSDPWRHGSQITKGEQTSKCRSWAIISCYPLGVGSGSSL